MIQPGGYLRFWANTQSGANRAVFIVQTVLDELGDGFPEQVLDVVHAADIRPMQQITDFLSFPR